MTRFGNDDYDEQFNNQGLLWWSNIERHIKGQKGQAVLREIREILLAMPEKMLINGRLADEQGHVCAVGAVALARRVGKGEDRDEVLRDLANKIPEDDNYMADDITASVGVLDDVVTVLGLADQYERAALDQHPVECQVALAVLLGRHYANLRRSGRLAHAATDSGSICFSTHARTCSYRSSGVAFQKISSFASPSAHANPYFNPTLSRRHEVCRFDSRLPWLRRPRRS